jgi:hypothetical protein
MPRRVLRQCRRLALYLFAKTRLSVIVLVLFLRLCEIEISGRVICVCGFPVDSSSSSFDSIFSMAWHVFWDVCFLDAGRGRNLPDGVAGAQTNPLRDGAVLTLSFGKLLLGAESLVAL